MERTISLGSPHPLSFGVVSRLRRMARVRRDRRRLAEMSDHLLSDIGVSRDDALTEAERPIWDVPATWRR